MSSVDVTGDGVRNGNVAGTELNRSVRGVSLSVTNVSDVSSANCEIQMVGLIV
jgi:hypothetical protein